MKSIPDTEDEIFIQAPSSTLNFLFLLIPPQVRVLHLHGYYTQYLSEITEHELEVIKNALKNIGPNIESIKMRLSWPYRCNSKQTNDILSSLQGNITELDLGMNEMLSNSTAVEIEDSEETISSELQQTTEENSQAYQKLFAIPATVKILNLSSNHLENISLDALEKLKGVLNQVETLYISIEEVQAMTHEQRSALNDVFPNIKKVILTQRSKKNIIADDIVEPDFREGANLARKYGFKTEVSSLLNTTTFFVQKNLDNVGLENIQLPDELNRLVRKKNPLP